MFPPRMPVRRAVEVYPHTAIVALFGLASTLKYKAKPGRTLQSRAAALDELLDHLEALRAADPPLDVRAAPRWGELRAKVTDPGRVRSSRARRTKSTPTSARTPPLLLDARHDALPNRRRRDGWLHPDARDTRACGLPRPSHVRTGPRPTGAVELRSAEA